jgi:thioredoxin reductase (NADPH)
MLRAMSDVLPPQPIEDARRGQIYPTLTPAEVNRLRRFGEVRSFKDGETLAVVGQTGLGMTVMLSGHVVISQTNKLGERRVLVVHGPGAFMGELAQLSGKPALVDAHAEGDGEGIVILPERLRALLIAEAELGERIMRALILRRVAIIERGGSGPVILGRSDDGDVLRLENFLGRNGHPHQRLDPAVDADARLLIEKFNVEESCLPIVLCPGGQLLRNPSEGELARCLGLVGPIDPDRLYDVGVIGAGPAGLAAAVYAASEGLSVMVLDCRAFGGQAGASARIENYLGFPTGVSGMALMARAYNQAQKFGAEMAIPDEAIRLETRHRDGGGFNLILANDEKVGCRSVVLATGARYRRLHVARLDEFEGASVHYWASPLEAKLVANQEVALVGAGNSAGQAVVFLASQAKKVWLLVRGESLEASMSRYLIERIEQLPNVEVVTRASVTALDGEDGVLETVSWRRQGEAEEATRAIRHLFLFIGAEPNTDWLRASGLELDPRGFVRTGADLGPGARPMETSLPGVFAIGDVRSGSTKRVAAAVGEGAQVVATLHTVLAATETT